MVKNWNQNMLVPGDWETGAGPSHWITHCMAKSWKHTAANEKRVAFMPSARVKITSNSTKTLVFNTLQVNLTTVKSIVKEQLRAD